MGLLLKSSYCSKSNVCEAPVLQVSHFRGMKKSSLKWLFAKCMKSSYDVGRCFGVIVRRKILTPFNCLSGHESKIKCVVFQITEQIKILHQEKLKPFKIEIAKDDATALKLVSEFEATIYTPAVVCAQSRLAARLGLKCLSVGVMKGPQSLNGYVGNP